MRILFDHQVFSIQRYGGVSRYFVELLRALRQVDSIEVDVIAPAHVNAYLASGDSKHPLTFSLPHPQTGLRYRASLLAPLVRLASYLGSPDVVHETHYALGSTHVPNNTRLVTTCHDMVFEKFPHWISGAADRAALKRKTFERADAIICISNNTRTDLLEIYPDLEPKVAVVHHGVDHTIAQASPAPFSQPYLLYVGVRDGYKNFETLMHALGRSKQLRENFHLVCFGGGTLSANEREVSRRAGFSPDNIHQLTGSDSVLASLYKHAAAFVFPSLYEGFGMPLTEAMVQGCPIACSAASCFPEICADAAVYFNPCDADDMSFAIETLVSKPRDLVSSSVTLRGKQFSWSRCATETAHVYQSLG